MSKSISPQTSSPKSVANRPVRDDVRLQRIERLGYLLDNSIRLPGGYRIGWDAIIGLIPGFGDVAGFVLSAYIVYEAARFRVPKATLGRMVINLGVEALVGLLPFLGDLFDAAFKANLRNLDLLHHHIGEDRRSQERSDRGFVLVLLAVLLLIVGGLGVGLFLLLRAVFATELG